MKFFTLVNKTIGSSHFVNELKHFLTKHPKEMLYFIIIYTLSFSLGTLLFLMLKKHNPSLVLMLLALIVPAIPACFFSEYSMRKIGYKRPILAAGITFILISSAILFVTNLDHEFLPVGWNYIFTFVFVVGTYISRKDTCSCDKHIQHTYRDA